MANPRRTKSVKERISDTFTRPKGPLVYQYGDIVVFGMEKVGKTSIINRFVNNYFTEKYNPTTSTAKYDVEALIECEKGEEAVDDKKKMVFKKSFKKSVMGKSKPLKPAATMKRVLTVSKSGEANSSAFEAGKMKGLKSLQFRLVDTPPFLKNAEPFGYQATIANAKGFILVCSFDVEGSLDYVTEICKDIRNERGEDAPTILIANKADLAGRLWDELDANTVAAQLKIRYCLSSVATKEGCEKMAEVMLDEINIFAEEESYQNSLPEDHAYNYIREEEYF